MLCERTRGDAEKTWRSSHGKAGHRKAEAFRAPLKPMSGQAGAMRDPSVAAGAALSLVAATKGGETWSLQTGSQPVMCRCYPTRHRFAEGVTRTHQLSPVFPVDGHKLSRTARLVGIVDAPN